MSFIGSLLNSIGNEGSPGIPPVPPPSRKPTPSTATAKPPVAAVLGTSTPLRKTQSPSSLSDGGQKRKAEDSLPQRPDKASRPNPTSTSTVKAPTSNSQNVRSTSLPAKSAPLSRPSGSTSALPNRSASKPATPVPTAPAVSSKPPPKGSFAEIMARAKAAQANAPKQIGMIKHEAKPKERLSKTEKRRREQESREKELASKGAKSKRSGLTSAKPAAQNGAGAEKKRVTELDYKGTARPPANSSRPVPAESSYKGTAGMQGRRPPAPKAGRGSSYGRSRQDEYLATDEEDEGDDYGDDYDDYSDESDMEAGAFDVEEEERRALVAAKRDDAEEQALEAKLKREKEERKRRLAALAAKSRR